MNEITYQRLGFVLYPDNESLAIKKESGLQKKPRILTRAEVGNCAIKDQ